jgi:uncharacterized delta-60 repeat protein
MFKYFALITIFLFGLIGPAFAFPGSLDPFFGTGGVSTAPIGKGGYDQSYAAALQPDGKIVIVGDSRSNSEMFSEEGVNFIVSRVNTDGTLDTSFGLNGIATRRLFGVSRANSVVIQPDGKILIGGSTIVDSGTPSGALYVFLLARFNPDGSTDNSFGTNGLVTTSFFDISSFWAQVTSVALQADGKIVAAGYTLTGSAGFISMAVARYNSNGTLDTGFDGDGRALVDFTTPRSRANEVAIQTDGKIVIAGLTREAVGSISDFAAARLNGDGTLDTGFDGDGRITTKFTTTSSAVQSIGIQTDGKIVAVGYSILGSARDIAIARYLPDGALDTSFDGDGKLTTDIGDDLAESMAIQTDGKIVVCGQSFAAPNTLVAFMSARYNTDGSLDNSYNGNGKVLTQLPDRVGRANAAFIRPDGKIILAGHANTFNVSDFAVLRYEANGILDTTFEGDGIAVVEPGNSADWIYDMAVQPDGKIVAAGYGFEGFFQTVTVARFLPGGALDTSFGNQGSVIHFVQDLDTYANDVIVQPDGKILVSVGSYFPGRYTTLRYNANGTPDNSFGTAGVATISVGIQSDNAAAMVLQPDGKIVVAGFSNDSPSVGILSMIRMNPDGTSDNSFGSGGSSRFFFTQHQNSITTMALQNDGKIIIAGSDSVSGSEGFFVCRFTSNGGFDNSFGDAGAAYATFGANSYGSSVAIQKDGKIVVSGTNTSDGALARFNTNGTLDTSFDGDGKYVVPPQGGTHFSLTDIAIQRNGKIVASAVAYIPPSEGLTDDGSVVLRINTNGSLDTSFGSGGVAFNSIGDRGNGFYTTLVLPNGRILAGGYSSNGANDDFTLARFQAEQTARFDYDGDGRSDISVFRPSEGNWYIQNSSNMGVSSPHFGQNGDLTTPGDFDGDGKADIAVYRPSEGNWYRLNSGDGTFFGTHFGTAEDKPAVGDFDGDGRADISVFRPSEGNWYRLNSIDGSFFGTHFGAAEDKPAVGDFDGDGKADISVFRPSEGNWYRLNSSDGSFFGTHFGVAEDKPTIGDFDGDGKTDISVFRPSEGNWYRLNSNDGSFFGMHFGLGEDKPVAADYDGDGKADIGVFRPSEGNWYILNSTAGFLAQHFGAAEDKPTPFSFVY